MRVLFKFRRFTFQICRNVLLLLLVSFLNTSIVGAAELKIWVKAFIPSEHATNPGYVLPRPGHPSEFMIPDPIETGVCFATDDRMFSTDPAASARMTSVISLVFSDGNLSQTQSHRTGPTRVFWCADGTEKSPPMSASTDQMYWGAPARADGNLQVTLEARANNPHVPGSPNIYYAGNFLFSSSNNKLRYQLTIGRFPAFEAYAQLDGGTVVEIFTQGPAEGSDVWSLISFGGMGTRTVSGELDF